MEREDIEEELKAKRIVIAARPSNLFKDKFDDESDSKKKRFLVYLNCDSKYAATEACQKLNETKSPELALEQYGFVLQAVLKTELSKVTWERFRSEVRETVTVEGKVATKNRTECSIEQPHAVFIEKGVFHGDDGAWNQVIILMLRRVTIAQNDVRY